MSFTESYRKYIRASRKSTQFGSDVHTIAHLEPALHFLYENWWKVSMTGLGNLPKEGPALIVGNSSGFLPWAGVMLLYALMSQEGDRQPRRLNIACEMGWIDDERIHHLGREVGFVPWSADHVRKLFSQGELVAVFPEGTQGASKPFAERYRLREFDWTRILPAIEDGIPIYPMATLGCDESFPVLHNADKFAKWLDLPAFPITPFMPWLPFPLNMVGLPGHWKMNILKKSDFTRGDSRNETYETALNVSHNLEGEIQAELNRMLRTRIKAIL